MKKIYESQLLLTPSPSATAVSVMFSQWLFIRELLETVLALEWSSTHVCVHVTFIMRLVLEAFTAEFTPVAFVTLMLSEVRGQRTTTIEWSSTIHAHQCIISLGLFLSLNMEGWTRLLSSYDSSLWKTLVCDGLGHWGKVKVKVSMWWILPSLLISRIERGRSCLYNTKKNDKDLVLHRHNYKSRNYHMCMCILRRPAVCLVVMESKHLQCALLSSRSSGYANNLFIIFMNYFFIFWGVKKTFFFMFLYVS